MYMYKWKNTFVRFGLQLWHIRVDSRQHGDLDHHGNSVPANNDDGSDDLRHDRHDEAGRERRDDVRHLVDDARACVEVCRRENPVINDLNDTETLLA